MENNKKNNHLEHLYGIDYLRVILCIGVVALHSNIFSLANCYVGMDPGNPWYYRLLVYNYFWCAVPTFYTLSLFLFFRRISSNESYIGTRLKKVVIIYIFWAIVDFILLNGGNAFNIIKSCTTYGGLLLLLMSNGTIAYFLFNLIYLTVFSALLHLFMRKPSRWKTIAFWCLFVLSLLCMTNSIEIAAKITGSTEFANALSYNNPALFFPYIFLAYILNKIIENVKHVKISIIVMTIGWIGFAICDYYLRANGLILDTRNYESLGRISLVFESGLLVLLSCILSEKIKHVPLIIKKISEASMTIYITHTIILLFIRTNFASIGISPDGLLVFILTFSLSAIFAIVIKNVKGLI